MKAFDNWWDKQDIPIEKVHDIEIEMVKNNCKLSWKAALLWVKEKNYDGLDIVDLCDIIEIELNEETNKITK